MQEASLYRAARSEKRGKKKKEPLHISAFENVSLNSSSVAHERRKKKIPRRGRRSSVNFWGKMEKSRRPGRTVRFRLRFM